MAIQDRFDLEKQMTFYMSYHDNFMNQVLHMICIWPILITAMMLMAESGPLAPTPDFIKDLPFGDLIVLNIAAPLAAIYMVWYIVLDPMAGCLGAAGVFTGFVYACHFVEMVPAEYGMPGWHISLSVHIVSWIIQFIGHGVFEGRKPALLDSLDQALVTAPMFVLLEILFPLGYRHEMYMRIRKQVDANVKAYKAVGKTL